MARLVGFKFSDGMVISIKETHDDTLVKFLFNSNRSFGGKDVGPDFGNEPVDIPFFEARNRQRAQEGVIVEAAPSAPSEEVFDVAVSEEAAEQIEAVEEEKQEIIETAQEVIDEVVEEKEAALDLTSDALGKMNVTKLRKLARENDITIPKNIKKKETIIKRILASIEE